MRYTPSTLLRLRQDLGADADWLAARIEEDPGMLGLARTPLSFERAVPGERPGQFAAILLDPAAGVRHVVEVQLGDADLDQVLRAVGRWAQEHRRVPDIGHRAALVAERVPPAVARAMLFAHAVAPIRAAELHPLRVGNTVILHARPVPLPGRHRNEADQYVIAALMEIVKGFDLHVGHIGNDHDAEVIPLPLAHPGGLGDAG